MPLHAAGCITIFLQVFLALLVWFGCPAWNKLALRKGAYAVVVRELIDLYARASWGIAVWVYVSW